jgi:hypothetical protein
MLVDLDEVIAVLESAEEEMMYLPIYIAALKAHFGESK